jgi:hypothetical protein
VRNAEARAGEQRHGQLRNHGHVHNGAIAGFIPQLLQDGGEAAHQAVELLIGDDAHVTGLAFENNGGLGAAAGLQVAIEAVVASVHFAIGKPFREGRIPDEGFGERLEPMQLADGQFRPELSRIGLGAFAKRAIGGALHLRAAGESGARRIGYIAHGDWQRPVYRRGGGREQAVKTLAANEG